MKGNQESDDDEDVVEAKLESQTIYIENPQCIQSLRKLFKKNTRQYKIMRDKDEKLKKEKDDEKKEDSDEELKLKNISFKAKMQQKKAILTDDFLMNRDNSLKIK